LEQLQTLTLLEAVTLVEKIEQTFGVDTFSAKDIQGLTSLPGNNNKEEIEEKTEFDLILIEVPVDKKIEILKFVRSIAGLGLRESKVLVEAAPKIVKEAMTKDAAETAKKELEAAGAKVEIK
jgi:large subunit ribosomal protein L7/L12